VTAPLPEAIEGKYQVLRKVREGWMGAIYQVRHRLLDEIRAIKVLRPQLAANEAQRRRFHREARTAIRLKHPNIAQLYDFAVDPDGVGYIVMEWIDGVTLEQTLRRHGPPELQLGLEISQQALEALGYLHGRGFIHRDVSPDNLMLTRSYNGAPLVKLIDLGIAKGLAEEGSLTVEGTFLGKVRYASPEQFSSAEQDERSDIYSFGVLLYELLTGRCPIVGETIQDLAVAHLMKPPLPFDQSDPTGRLPQGLRETILQTLEKKPEDRVQGAAALSAALSGFRQPLAIEAIRKQLEVILSSAPAAVGPDSSPQPGSTQERLNRQFAPGTTPSPHDRLSELSQVTHKLDLLLERGWLEEASRQLDDAMGRFQDDPELDRLRGRLARELSKRRESETVARLPADESATEVAVGNADEAILDLHYDHPIPEGHRAHRAPHTGRRWLVGVITVVAAVALGWLAWTRVPLWKAPTPPPAPLEVEFRIQVLSEPPGATVWIDGTDSQLTTPASLPVAGRPGETVHLDLRQQGTIVSSHEIVLEQGIDLEWSAALPVPLETYLILSDPAGARLFLEDRPIPGATPLAVELDPQETYALRLELEGHATASLEVRPDRLDADARAAREIRVSLPAITPPGLLVIETRYPIRVRVKGKTYRISRYLEISLEPGSYEVRISSPEVYYSSTRNVTIDSGGRVKARPADLTPLTLAATPSNCRVRIDGGEPRFVPFTLDIAIGKHRFDFEWPGLGTSTTRTEEIRPDTERLFESAPER